MSFKSGILALATALLLASKGLAQSVIVVDDPYMRTSRPNAPTGAAFMVLRNTGDAADRLVAVSADIAKRVELHTHRMDSNGVAQMMEVEQGFEIPAGGEHALKRGGDHVMFMGLNRNLEDGDSVTLTLTFEHAGDIVVTIPVDLAR